MKVATLFPLLGYYNNLTPNDDYQRIILILLQNMNKLGNMTIHEAADLCYTSPATISRIAKRAGYDGYQALKESASQFCSTFFNENRILPVEQVFSGDVTDTYLDVLSSHINQLKEMINQKDIDKAADILHNSDYIFSVGHGLTAETLEMNLFFNGKHFETVKLGELDAKSIIDNYKDKNTSIIIFNPGYPWMKSLNSEYILKDAGIKVILITTPFYLPEDDKLDCIIRIPGLKTSFDALFHSIVLTILGITYRKEYIDKWYKNTI